MNKNGGINKRKSPGIQQSLKVLFSLDYHKNFKNYSSYDKNETEPVWLSPVFAIFQAPPCKVIRIGKRVQPDISKARQQVKIDRPAYTRTDKQCRTRTTITARLPDG